MDDKCMQVNATSAYDQTSQVRDAERQKLDQLILGGPGLINPQDHVNKPSDDGLRPEDHFELSPTDAPAPSSPLPPPPPAGKPVSKDAEDVALSVDGRGAAVALQEYLQGLIKAHQDPQFEATAKALGVTDISAFKRAVEGGNALQSFAHVDSNRLVFTDQNFNEVEADQLSAVAKAQLVVKPSFEVPIDPRVTAPEVTLLDPNIHLQDRLETPIFQDPAEQLRLQQTQPQALHSSDGVQSPV